MPFMYSNASDSSSPTPSESDFGYDSYTSASSLPSTPSPKQSTPKSTRLSLKPSLKFSESLDTDSSRKSPSAIVRFAEPAPTPTLNPKWGAKRKTLRKSEPLTKKRTNPLVVPQPHSGLPFASPTASLSKDINGSYFSPAPAPPNFSRPRSQKIGRIFFWTDGRIGQKFGQIFFDFIIEIIQWQNFFLIGQRTGK